MCAYWRIWPSASRRAISISLQWVFKPTTPWKTCTPASCKFRDQRMLEASSKRAFNSTTTATSFLAAASISARTMGELSLVRYSVCLMESTSGSFAALSMNRTTAE